METPTSSTEISEESIQSQLQTQQEALVKIYKSVEQTRKIMLWTGIANLAFFVVPLILAVVLLPTIMNTFTSSLGILGEDNSSLSNTEIQSVPSLRDSLENLNGLGF